MPRDAGKVREAAPHAEPGDAALLGRLQEARALDPLLPPVPALVLVSARLLPRCGSRDVEWRKASGRGRLYTFAIHYRAFHPGWSDEVPYVTALIDLDEGVRLFSNLVGIEPDPKVIRCEMPVEVVFEDVTPEVTLPKWRPA